jgi:guanylate kinase
VAGVDWNGLPGRLFVVSGPSGSGKSTLVRRVLAHPGIRAQLSVSATTRRPRAGEEEGRDYFFLSRGAFEAARDRGEFLEWAEVHGNLYGTPAGPVREALAEGRCVLLEIDVQGALQVRDRAPAAELIFVNAPSLEVLEGRLRARGTDDEATIQRRLANARGEIGQIHHYQAIIVNDRLDRAAEEMASHLNKLGCGG